MPPSHFSKAVVAGVLLTALFDSGAFADPVASATPAAAPVTAPAAVPVATPSPASVELPVPTPEQIPVATEPSKPSPTPAPTSAIVNAAPDFSGGAEAGRTIKLSSLRGTPVLLVIAASPRTSGFKSQISRLRGAYERLAAQGMLCFAAFTSEGGTIHSNIPFILVNDPAATAAAYDVRGGFAVILIGRDGNLDCLSTKPLPGQRILDLVLNNAAMQTLLRR